ncbi:hypothetical protein K490DRAFT_59044 [Saccharata proteae CBS 121410]|uniref:Uncharacterized protein n=1 Tax=Saccharata proteae CBS 121410 TaxID=1314787 RepID=A0A9P4HQF8_9PEZI|nr:hypothetical protein K490DRAFT_59044 [Saccharata proteae CBS 121410]
MPRAGHSQALLLGPSTRYLTTDSTTLTRTCPTSPSPSWACNIVPLKLARSAVLVQKARMLHYQSPKLAVCVRPVRPEASSADEGVAKGDNKRKRGQVESSIKAEKHDRTSRRRRLGSRSPSHQTSEKDEDAEDLPEYATQHSLDDDPGSSGDLEDAPMASPASLIISSGLTGPRPPSTPTCPTFLPIEWGPPSSHHGYSSSRRLRYYPPTSPQYSPGFLPRIGSHRANRLPHSRRRSRDGPSRPPAPTDDKTPGKRRPHTCQPDGATERTLTGNNNTVTFALHVPRYYDSMHSMGASSSTGQAKRLYEN